MKYVNGSDVLFDFGGGAFGHATSHTLTMTSELKSRQVKPAASATSSAGKWEDKTEVKKNITLSVEGLRFKDETEKGYKSIVAAWYVGKPVVIKAFERSKDSSPYLTADFLITSVTETSPAGDDATYSAELEIAGEPTNFDASKLTGETITTEESSGGNG